MISSHDKRISFMIKRHVRYMSQFRCDSKKKDTKVIKRVKKT